MTTGTPAAEPAASAAPAHYEFDAAFKSKIVALTLRDTVFAQRTEGLVLPEYFEDELDATITGVALDFYKTYKKAPDKSSMTRVFATAIADKRIRADMVSELKKKLAHYLTMPISDRDFVIDSVAEFAKERAISDALLASVHALGKRDYGKISDLMGKAMTVGATDDGSEYDYFDEIDSRTATRVAITAGTIKPTGITTGYPDIDKHLYHGGWGRRELSALMARAKWGKSMGLGDFGMNAAIAGYNVFIGSCEVSALIYADRCDASLTDTMMKELKTTPFDVRDKLEAIKAKAHGVLKIHDFASGTLKPSALRRLIEKYRTRGIIFDMIVLDYADIMCPDHFVDDMRENSRSIWLDLRAIAYEQNAAVLTATQTNRDGAKAMVAKATDVAEDYNKIRTADLVISGNATDAEIASGEARLVFAASRNQAELTIRIKQDRERMKFLTKVLGVEK
jgi:replicative DNA helicase